MNTLDLKHSALFIVMCRQADDSTVKKSASRERRIKSDWLMEYMWQHGIKTTWSSSRCTVYSSSHDLSAYTVMWKRHISSCCPAWLLTTVIKNVCEIYLYVFFFKKEHMDSWVEWKTWTVRLVHFGKMGGKLATFTFVNFTAKVSNSKVHHCAVAIRNISVSPWCFQMLHLSTSMGTVRKKKVLNIEQSVCGFASIVQKPELADQNFWHTRNSSNHPMTGQEQIISPWCPLCTEWKTAPDEIWPNTLMSNAAQIIRTTVYAQLNASSCLLLLYY